ncbi:outer membrane receptor protein involved in Fe transport [Chitinophaga skermanii]|uniref:Outer membrane receptor protein involved in Fe transport n=1 Tax=Chitinophaga skermanii TaxID=331697 RepID=A0A327QUK3_9BACT|nr:TonB-dependent receptor [Chitinophaga skermanii]RAJ08289.1 outer membrane receptor protein involved in Fe transport [Chitinophaga skermanii]
MTIRQFLFTFSLCLLTLAAAAQQTGAWVISGKITASTNGQPIPGATVRIQNTKLGAVSDENGTYTVRVSNTGKYTLEVSAVGFDRATKTIQLTTKNTSIDFTLAPGKNLDEVQVYGKTQAQVLKEQAFTINAIDTKQYANTTADLNQVLSRTTGVRVREQGGVGSDFTFSINGLSGKSVKYFLDGVPLDIMGSTMSLNNIPVNLAKRIEVYKGVVPVDYGSDALGGIVNIVTDQSTQRFLDASYSYGSFNTHRASLNAQFKPDSASPFIIRVSSFYNYADNNYTMRGVEVWDEKKYDYVEKDFNRFHDQYRSAMGQIEAGVVNRKWADVFFVGFSGSGYNQELQTGIEQQMVYGAAVRKGHSLNGSVRYKKSNLFTEGLHLNFYGAIAADEINVVDTAMRRYQWDGTYVKATKPEMSNEPTISKITRPRQFARLNISYDINKQHSFNLNYTFDHIQNKSYNTLKEDRDHIPSTLGKHVIGIAYQQTFFDGRWANTFFGKMYGVGTQQSQVLRFDTNGAVVYERLKDFQENYGYGVATRFKITGELGVKASYERAYRLQEAEEMFGNGYLTVPNLTLKPESSNNFNAGFYYSTRLGKHNFYTEAGYFNRNADDFIYYVPAARRYENKSSVKINGFEGEVKYQYADLIGGSFNLSYQRMINNTRFTKAGSTVPDITFGNKVPNQPSLFWNADVNIGKNNLLGKGSRIQLNWYTQYVHWFYLSWEAYGNINSNPIIPKQLIHNAVLTYSMHDGTYNIGVECRNLSDEIAYDNFRLQKPGRAFAVKLRYFIR